MMLAFVCLVLLCVCVVPGATVRQCVVHCLLVTPCTLLSLSPFLPVCTSSFPFIHQTSFSGQRLSLDATYAAFLVAPVRRHASRHFPHAVSSQRRALLPSAVSGARCFPHDDLPLSLARLLTLRALVLEARSPLVPSLVPSLSFTHTTHTHSFYSPLSEIARADPCRIALDV